MRFTYKAYGDMLALLKTKNYRICTYGDHMDYGRCVILRHDVDFCLERALKMAEMEINVWGVKSTFFLLLSSDFYNIASRKNIEIIGKIKDMGHEIGLHFDEAGYSKEELIQNVPVLVEKEVKIMSDVLNTKIDVVSMHRPSLATLAADYKFNGAVNSYSREYFERFKYLSDSRHFWREPVMDIVEAASFDKLHILTHPFWYCEKEWSAAEKCEIFINEAGRGRYASMRENIRDFDKLMKEEDKK